MFNNAGAPVVKAVIALALAVILVALVLTLLNCKGLAVLKPVTSIEFNLFWTAFSILANVTFWSLIFDVITASFLISELSTASAARLSAVIVSAAILPVAPPVTEPATSWLVPTESLAILLTVTEPVPSFAVLIAALLIVTKPSFVILISPVRTLALKPFPLPIKICLSPTTFEVRFPEVPASLTSNVFPSTFCILPTVTQSFVSLEVVTALSANLASVTSPSLILEVITEFAANLPLVTFKSWIFAVSTAFVASSLVVIALLAIFTLVTFLSTNSDVPTAPAAILACFTSSARIFSETIVLKAILPVAPPVIVLTAISALVRSLALIFCLVTSPSWIWARATELLASVVWPKLSIVIAPDKAAALKPFPVPINNCLSNIVIELTTPVSLSFLPNTVFAGISWILANVTFLSAILVVVTLEVLICCVSTALAFNSKSVIAFSAILSLVTFLFLILAVTTEFTASFVSVTLPSRILTFVTQSFAKSPTVIVLFAILSVVTQLSRSCVVPIELAFIFWIDISLSLILSLITASWASCSWVIAL